MVLFLHVIPIVKFGSTRRALNFWFANCPSNALFVRLHKTSRYNKFTISISDMKIVTKVHTGSIYFLYLFFFFLALIMCSYSEKISLFLLRRICGSRVMLYLRSRRLLRLTLLVCLRIPTSAPSMPKEWPLCQRISSLQGEFVVKGPKCWLLLVH